MLTLLDSNDDPDHYFRNFVMDCRSLLSWLQLVKLKHVYQKVNRCADALVKLGCKFDMPLVIFVSCPREISFAYDEDNRGACLPRNVRSECNT